MRLEESHQPRHTRVLGNLKRALDQGPCARAATQALNDNMAETYTDLKRGMDDYTHN